jgi:hypothetical protein
MKKLLCLLGMIAGFNAFADNINDIPLTSIDLDITLSQNSHGLAIIHDHQIDYMVSDQHKIYNFTHQTLITYVPNLPVALVDMVVENNMLKIFDTKKITTCYKPFTPNFQPVIFFTLVVEPHTDVWHEEMNFKNLQKVDCI